MNVIETVKLTKTFGKFTAVDGVSLSVGKGEIYGFLGLNGAGKTTMIRMLLGLIAPSAGTVRVLGTEVRRGGHGPWADVGSLVEVPYAYPELTVRENLDLVRKLRHLGRETVGDVIDKLSLAAYADRKAKHLSLGNAQRLGLAKALIHKPRVLVLDEPSNGLDPEGIVEIRELLLKLARREGVTIFISSHILGEIARIADRIGIIHEGALLQEIKADMLKALLQKRLVIETRDNPAAIKLLAKHGRKAGADEGGAVCVSDSESLRAPEEVTALLAAAGLPPRAVFTEKEDLEAYFLRVITEKGGRT
ncbi:MAG TPA: ABC transporter ATP-binding protein [Bacillales bacterium]|nr:ABC transporter ATP-binding protein [Bacillales bacterium]